MGVEMMMMKRMVGIHCRIIVQYPHDCIMCFDWTVLLISVLLITPFLLMRQRLLDVFARKLS